MSWFKNLKKWQKGGLIGCAVGLFFACLMMLPLTQGIDSWTWIVRDWVANFHAIFLILSVGLSYFWGPSETSPHAATVILYEWSAAIVVFYGVLGILTGGVQQMASPIWKWLLTALLALFLLGFYVMNYNFLLI